jgi:hypothetical protein
MSPIVTRTASPPGLRRSRSTIASERSIPSTRIPRAARGRAMRPVPTASSSAGPLPVRAASTSTVRSMTAGSNSAPSSSS